jgi:flavin-dependent dehydrogenase
VKLDADVLIVGGGPAGLACAIRAAMAGLSPVIIESTPGTIDKACGEGLMPGAIRSLDEMGVRPMASHLFEGIRYISGERVAEGRFPKGPGRGVRRLALHDALRERAEELGVTWHHARAGEIQQDDTSVEVAGLRGRWLVAADGLNSGIRRQLGLERPARRSRPRLGLRQHYAVRPWSPHVEVYWSDDAEAYVTPVDDELVGVAVLFSGAPLPPGRGAQSRYNTLLERFPTLKARLTQPASILRGSGPFERRTSQRTAGRVLLIGDAAGYLDPLTGEGVRLGFATAKAAIARIQQDRPQAYERDWRQITRRYWWMTGGLLWLRDQPRLRPLMLPALQASPWMFSQIVGALADD